MNENGDEETLRAKLSELTQEHRDLDMAIAALIAFGVALVVPALGDGLARLLAPVARLGERIPRTRSGLAGGLLVGVALALSLPFVAWVALRLYDEPLRAWLGRRRGRTAVETTPPTPTTMAEAASTASPG